MIKRSLNRGLIACCLAAVLTISFDSWIEVPSVSAAPTSSVTTRQDRRPDRERPVKTWQGSSQSSQQGFSQSSSSGRSSTSSRPRLVRR